MRIVALLLLCCGISTAGAQDFRLPSIDNSRAGKWDIAFQLAYLPSQSYTGQYDSSLDLKSRTGFGFDLNYNLNDYFALGFDFSWINPNYTLTIEGTSGDDPDDTAPADQVISHRADIITGQFTGTWNLLKTRFTPFVDVGAGWTNIDSNIASGTPVCWWDPWWGWVCSSSSYSESNFSYSGSVGLRWEVASNALLKLSVNRMIIDSGSNPEFDTIKFEIGARY